MIRELVTRFSSSLSERRAAPRLAHAAPIKIWFDPDTNSESALELARSLCLLGETVDMSRTGVGFIVPVIRVKEKYLVGHDRILNAEIDLPSGKVCLRLMGCRYEKVGIHISTERFLVGAQIDSIGDEDREIYEHFLATGIRRFRGAVHPVGIALK